MHDAKNTNTRRRKDLSASPYGQTAKRIERRLNDGLSKGSDTLQLNLQHSLRTHLAAVMAMPVIWIFDGVKLPDESAKPYMTIEQMQNNDEGSTKGREAVETIHRFQLGLFAKSATERARLQNAVSRTLRFDDINLIDVDKSTTDVVGFFNTKLTGVVPISAESVDARSTYHRVYFDVEIRNYYYR